MSAETKQNAETTKKHLESAEKNLQAASETARKTGDGSLVKRVEKIAQDTTETRKELDRRLSEKGGS
jgi:DNA anti-recombination protein RmuC